MGAKSVAARAANRKQRQKMNMSRYASSRIMVRPEHMMEENNIEIQMPFTGTVICQSCGFKARYKFHRCPQCDAEQK
jgi:hypothetical protein